MKLSELPQWPIIRRWGSFALFLIAMLSIFWSLDGQWPAILALVERLEIVDVLVAILIGIAMIVVSGLSLAVLAHPGSTSLPRLLAIARIYLVAQVLKYLPGRVWGLLYQVGKVRESTGGRMAVAASASQMLISAFGSLVVYGLATGADHVLGAIAIALLSVWIWRGGVARYMGIAGPEWAQVMQVARVLALVALEWLVFVGVAWMICRSMQLTDAFSFSLIALYAASWIVGSLAVVAPGGLVVREGGFVLLCQLNGIPTDFAAAFALVARLVFTTAEVLAGVLAWLSPEIRGAIEHRRSRNPDRG